MKDLLTAMSKKSYIGRTLRSVIIAFVIVYVMIMSALLPVSTLYFEARAKEEDTFVGVLPSSDTIPVEEGDVEGDLLTDKEEEDIYVEEDRYTNTWNNEYNQEAEVVQEDESLRTVNEKHFRMSDGSYTMVSHANAIHYLENGKYKEIDNTLEKQGSSYKNKSNAMQVELPITYSKNSKTQVTYGDYRLTFKLDKFVTSSDDDLTIENKENEYEVKSKNKHKFKINNESKAKYKFDNSQVELEQILVGTELKENIILHSTLPSYTFNFDVKAKGLYLTLQANGDIYAISDSTEEIVFVIPKGYMFDANGEYCENVDYDLTEKASGYELQVIADEEWINAKERVFPITIDPSITLDKGTNFKSAAHGYGLGMAVVGDYTNVTGLDFELPSTLLNSVIIEARLGFKCFNLQENDLLSIWDCPEEFIEDNAFADIDISFLQDARKKPTAQVYLQMADDTTSIRDVYVDITNSIAQIVRGGELSQFHGFLFTGLTDGTSVILTEDVANEDARPIVEIHYRKLVGVESYWDYDQYSIGKDTIYINKFSDETTVVHEDTSISSLLPITLQHVYIGAYQDANYDVDTTFSGVNYGYGWKLNYQQIIRSRGSDFEYYDADGTMHYFYYNTEKGYAEDEDGLGLKIYGYTDNAFRMEDSNKNSMYFDYHGRLFKLSDRNGNVTNIIYGNGNQGTTSRLPITEINDGSAGKSIIFTYDSDGYLTQLNYKRADGLTIGKTVYNYDSSGHLTKILNDDNTYTTYSYVNNKLTQLSDESGYNLKFNFGKTAAIDEGLGLSQLYHKFPVSTVRSVFRSIDGINWIHVQDTVYENGYSISVRAKQGQSYIPYVSYDGSQSITESTLSAYYTNNHCIRHVYDNFGRLITSYLGSGSTITTVETHYEEPLTAGININNNKVNASVTYTPNIINYVQNGSFENGINEWELIKGSNHADIYVNYQQSTRYVAHGAYSIELFVSQPFQGEIALMQTTHKLTPGQYTLSAKVRVENELIPIYSPSSTIKYGAYVGVYNTTFSEDVKSDIYQTNDGWKKVSAHFEVTSYDSYKVMLAMYNCAGFAYFDEIQLTRNDYGLVDTYNNVNNPNLISDGVGQLPYGWSYWTDVTDYTVDKALGADGDTSILGYGIIPMLKGNIGGSINLYQITPIERNTQSCAYTFSMWYNHYGKNYKPLGANSYIRMNYKLYDSNKNAISGFYFKEINTTSAAWQQASMTLVVPPETGFIELNIQLNGTTTMLLVENVSLVKSSIINLEYDDYGNNNYYSDGFNQYTFDESETESIIGINGVTKYGVTKDEKGNVTSSSDFARQVKSTYQYDSLGRQTNETFTTITAGNKISTSIEYTQQTISNSLMDIVTDTDSLGFKTISSAYTYSGLLAKTTFNDGSYVEYDYGASNGNFFALPATISIRNKDVSGKILSSVVYNYFTMADALTSDTYGHRHVGALKSVEMSNGTTYAYEYDAWGNIIKVKLNGITQVTYRYRELDGALISKSLGDSGYTEYYTYDELYRLTRQRETLAYQTNVDSLIMELILQDSNYVYTVSGNVAEMRDIDRKKAYYYQYDVNGRLYLQAETSAFTENSNMLYSIEPQRINETIYDDYGNSSVVRQIYIETLDIGLTVNTKFNSSGTISRSRVGLKETIYIDGVEKIIYTYDSTNVEYGHVVREDNYLINTTTYPNGITIQYARDNYRNITGITVSAINATATNVVYSSSQNTIVNNSYEFDGGYENLWNVEWMQQNAPSVSQYPVSQLEDEESNGMTISNIIKIHHGTFYVSESKYYSLVDPAILKLGVLGSEITFWAKVLRLTSGGDTNIQVPRIRYSDGTPGNAWDKVENVAKNKLVNDGSWQFFSIPINKNKQIVAIELPWSNGAWLAIGNMNLYGKRDVWDADWAIANVATASLPVTKVATQKVSNTNVVTDIIRVHSGSFYAGNFGGTEVYQSLVNPDILANGGDRIVVSYQARIDELDESYLEMEDPDSLIRGLRFRYSDGVADYAGHASIMYTTYWQKITIVSAPGKQVIGIELGYNHGDWILLGDISVTLQNIGRLDNRLIGQNLSNDAYLSYEYDELGRQSEVGVYTTKGNTNSLLSETYSYLDGSDGNTTYNVTAKAISYGSSNGITYNYTYNLDNPALGDEQLERSNPYNIWQIKEGNTVKVEYSYDLLGRLIRENNAYANASITYAYDDNNNIISKTTYDYTTESILSGGTTVSYTYDTTYADRLLNYADQSISYNEVGFPLSYKGATLAWRNRVLHRYEMTTPSLNVSFLYDAEGNRTGKTVTNGTSRGYYYNGTQLIKEVAGSNTIYYLYGQTGLIGFELDGVSYYYVRNLLGDVTGVIDTSGNLVVQYTYDSWGKVLSTTGSMADTVGTLNPIRYRGYYYDVETGLYYLQSRYYDPETGRFISPDVIAEGGNIYTYCLNDPVNRSDESGYLSRRDKNIIKIAIGVVTTVAAVAITVATGGAALPVIAGVAASTLIGAGISAGITALQGGSDAEIFDSAVDGAINGFMWGGISAFASAAINGTIKTMSAAKEARTMANKAFIGEYGENTTEVLNAFRGTPNLTKVQVDTTVYRTWGGMSKAKGHWVSPKNYGLKARSKLSLPDCNTATNISTYIIPKGTMVLSGRASSLFGHMGGGFQWWVGLL